MNHLLANPPSESDQPTVLGNEPLPVSVASELAPGDRIGGFVIERLLGEGGMGVVYLARQVEPVVRTVALKLVRQQLRGGITEAYFEIERQALARMNHPAIATVYEAGTTAQGFPYFAMQWVDGVALDVWHARQPPNTKLRLKLAIKIARGVQHANQRGIIHRDLKPSNVLVEVVDGIAQPKIIDFGIALGVEAKPTGVVAGTGVYMSPEQARADPAGIDIRSDVYSLGVLLLALLVPPGDFLPLADELSAFGRSLQSGILRSLGRARVERRKIVPALLDIPWELRWMLARALAPDREQRYQSAQALADDLERFVALRPLDAAPDSRRYHAGKFIRRHRVPLATGFAILLALLGGLGAAVYGMRRAEAEAQKSGILAEFLSEVIAGADPEKAQAMDKTLMRLVLDSAAARAQAKLARQPAILSAVETVIGKSYDGLGESDKAVAFHRSAYQRLLRHLGQGNRETLTSGRVYVRTLANAGNPAEAGKLVDVLHQQATRVLGERDAETLRIEATRGWVLRELGRLQDARLALEHTFALQTEQFGVSDPDALDSSYALAIVLNDLGELSRAEPIYDQLIAIYRTRDGAEHPRVLGLRNSLGVLYLDQQRFAEAEALFRALAPQYQQVLGAKHAETLGVLGNLAKALSGLNRNAEAGAYLQQVLDGFEATLGAKHPWTLEAWNQMGTHRLALGEAKAALAAHEHARAGALSVLGPEHPFTFETMLGWANAAAQLGRFDDAERELEAALLGARKVYPAEHAMLRALEQSLENTRALRASAQQSVPPSS